MKCCHLQPAGPLLASCPSAFPVPSECRLTDKPSCLAALDPPPPQRERIIPPLCRPRYHRSSNKTAFRTQTPRGGRRHPNNTAAQRTTILSLLPESWGQSNPLQGLLYLLIVISPLLLLTSLSQRKRFSCSSDKKEAALSD